MIDKECALKTQIMWKANPSVTQPDDYLSSLVNKNLKTQTSRYGKEVYAITVKGLGFLRTHRGLAQMRARPVLKKPEFPLKVFSSRKTNAGFRNAQLPKATR